MELKFDVTVMVQKPVSEVFDAVYNPEKLRKYFATAGASAPLEEGAIVEWAFDDFDGGAAIPIKVRRSVKDSLITIEWEAGDGEYNTIVEFKFEPEADGETLLTITESGWKETQKALNFSYLNCHGWTQMQACLKAYLEYGIQLRKGYF